MIDAVSRRMQVRSMALLSSIEANLIRLMGLWLIAGLAAVAVRIGFSPVPSGIKPVALAPYVLLIFTPAASMALALRWFADGGSSAQPMFRLARLGRWRSIAPAEARRHPLYGVGGIMLSLLIGLLLNVPLRTVEYLAAMPALSGRVPAWLDTLRLMMTVDAVLLSSLYTIAFVAALRRNPTFPRLLMAIWLIDLSMQIVTAQVIAARPDLPGKVAAALPPLIEGNINKVLIGIALWLPYLLLSKRVNVTFRHRVPA